MIRCKKVYCAAPADRLILAAMAEGGGKKKPHPDIKVEVVFVAAPDAIERLRKALELIRRRAAAQEQEESDERTEI